MKIKNVRFLVVAAALCMMLGAGQTALAEDSLPVLRGLTAEAGPGGPVIHLSATGELDTVHYTPQPGVWIVEMPEASWDQADGLLTEPDLGIERAELSRVEEFGKRLSRLTVWLGTPSQLELVPVPEGLDLRFSSLDLDPPAAAAVRKEQLPVVPVAAAPEVPAAETRSASRVVSLVEVTPQVSDGGLIIEFDADGPLSADLFTLPSPARLVVDLYGVINRVERGRFTLQSPVAERVRVAQNRTVPEPVTRLVVDINGEVEHDFISHADGATLKIAALGTELDTLTAPEQFGDDEGAISIVRSQPEVEQPPAVPASMFEPQSEEATAEDTPEPEAVAERPAVKPSQEKRNPWVAEPSQLIEQAPAGEVLDAPAGADAFETTEVESQEQQFTGEPITLTLKDADIKDVLRTFSELTQLNIVLDPSVSGSVTVELRDVPWDQALDLILRINNLDYILENNVLRVAPISKLQAEKAAKAAFLQEQEGAEPLRTVLKPLSYARAQYVQGLLQGDGYLLSSRGTVTVDERTNTLIIRDVVDRVEGILRLIETLDLPTPQVVIEARIVETTRDFSHELGVSWGFDGAMDAQHGNDTGLVFPNSIGASGGVELLAGGNGIVSFTFADILNTFNLDFTLAAAESDGLVTIVSTPRITTQNLQAASIRSGLQIPIQTVANNTVTVQYVDATLQLAVTPQITREGTVNLDLNINKREPQLGLAVAGGANAPIFTRQANTQLLVRDGGTTVIAGIYQINDQNSEDRVPGLAKIPIVKHLFKNKGVFKRHDELLIFVTPRIVKY